MVFLHPSSTVEAYHQVQLPSVFSVLVSTLNVPNCIASEVVIIDNLTRRERSPHHNQPQIYH